VFLEVIFRFACELRQIRAVQPNESAGVRSSILTTFKSEPYMLDAYLGKDVFYQPERRLGLASRGVADVHAAVNAEVEAAMGLEGEESSPPSPKRRKF
jgi:hypothetical protein